MKILKSGTIQGEMKKRETVKLPEVMIALKKSRMGTCIIFLKHEQKDNETLIGTGRGKLKTDERKDFIQTLHN